MARKKNELSSKTRRELQKFDPEDLLMYLYESFSAIADDQHLYGSDNPEEVVWAEDVALAEDAKQAEELVAEIHETLYGINGKYKLR